MACLLLFAMWTWSLQKEVRRRLAAEEELRDQLLFQRAMLEGIPHVICVRDAQARLIFCNTAFEKHLGVARHQSEGKTLPETQRFFKGAQRTQEIHEKYLKLLAEGVPINEDIDIVMEGGPRKVFHWAAPISLQEGGERIALIEGAFDVTERYRLLELVETARANAESANRAKLNFLATMSHEIRTPMNAVMGVLELLVREGRLVPPDLEATSLARTSAQSLLALIDDILDISKIEAGGLEVIPRPSQLRSMRGSGGESSLEDWRSHSSSPFPSGRLLQTWRIGT